MRNIFQNEEKASILFPCTWYYAEADNGKLLIVPINGGEIYLDNFLDNSKNLNNEKSAKSWIKTYRKRSGDKKTKFEIKTTIRYM